MEKSKNFSQDRLSSLSSFDRLNQYTSDNRAFLERLHIALRIDTTRHKILSCFYQTEEGEICFKELSDVEKLSFQELLLLKKISFLRKANQDNDNPISLDKIHVCQHLESVNIPFFPSTLNQEQFSLLSEFPELKHLGLITDSWSLSSIPVLKQLEALESLLLTSTYSGVYSGIEHLSVFESKQSRSWSELNNTDSFQHSHLKRFRFVSYQQHLSLRGISRSLPSLEHLDAESRLVSQLEDLKQCEHLKTLRLTNIKTNEDMQELLKLTNIEKLSFSFEKGGRSYPFRLSQLFCLKALKYLEFDTKNTEGLDYFLSFADRYEKLSFIFHCGNQLFRHISQLTELENLKKIVIDEPFLWGKKLSNQLQKLTQLEYLFLGNSSGYYHHEGAFDFLPALQQLRTLHVYCGAWLKPENIQGLKNQPFLSCLGINIFDPKMIPYLAEIPSLRELHLGVENLDPEALLGLKKARLLRKLVLYPYISSTKNLVSNLNYSSLQTFLPYLRELKQLRFLALPGYPKGEDLEGFANHTFVCKTPDLSLDETGRIYRV